MTVASKQGSPDQMRDLGITAHRDNGEHAESKNQPELEGESEPARIERLGRQRPEQLTSLWMEIGFVFSITMSQLLTEYFVSGFTVLIPTVARELHISSSATTWPVSAMSLVISSFMLPFGRLADIYGGFPVYLAGFTWFCAWSLIAGFAQNELMLDFCRALQGLGPAAYLPASLTLLGGMYRPGPRKNLVFSVYGAMAPLGFFIGILFAGVAAQYANWRWYFWIGALLISIVLPIAWFTIPNDMAAHRGNGVKMDWLGSFTTAGGLVLLVFAITDSAHAPHGWATPYIYVTFIFAIVSLSAACYVEGWVAEQPLIPSSMLKIPYMRPFILGLVFAYGSLGIYILYATLYISNIMHVGPMLLVAWYIPLALGGCIISTVSGIFLHRLPGTFLTFISGVAIIGSSLLFALAPPDATYWAYIFPAMIFSTIAIDLIFNVANIFFSTSLPARQQGLAGALSNVILQLAIALVLGCADIVASATERQGQAQSYKNAFWFEFACGCASLAVFLPFVRIQSAKSDLTADEKEEEAAHRASEEASEERSTGREDMVEAPGRG